MLVLKLVFLVGEVDKELRIALDGEMLDPEGHRDPEASDQALLFRDVVGDLLTMLKTELHNIVKLDLGRQDEYGPSLGWIASVIV